MLAEPHPTRFDLRFSLLGIPVRVTPFFWLVAFLLGDRIVRFVGEGPNEGDAKNHLLWIPAVLLSLLVHEFGHALAYRWFGLHPRVVLYHFGGLAIVDRHYAMGEDLDSKRQILISLAGPIAQLLLATAILLGTYFSGYHFKLYVPLIPQSWQDTPGDLLHWNPLTIFLYFLLVPSLVWALFNLLPIYPLDGGKIARELFLLFNVRDGIKNSLILSIAVAGSLAVYQMMQGDYWLGVMCALLAYSSYTLLQTYLGQGDWGGGGRPW